MARALYLHIGRHKTGSTSIQTLMDRERNIFLKHGFYPVRQSDYTQLNIITRETKRIKTNLYDLANLVIRAELMSGPRLRGVVPKRSHDEIIQMTEAANKILHSLPGKKILMSAEGFSILRTPQEGEYVDSLFKGFDLKVMLIEREKESWTQSYKNQIARLYDRYIDEIGKKGTLFDFSPESWQYDLSGLKAIFPQADCFQYEAFMEQYGSTLIGFLKWLNISESQFKNLDIWEKRRVQPKVTTTIS